MQVKPFEATTERSVLTAMIVNRAVLARVAHDYSRDMFGSDMGNLIASWCVKYYREYEDAPGATIQNIFESWATRPTADSRVIDAVERLLVGLSGEYERLAEETNSDFVLDKAAGYFTEVKVRRQAEAALADLDIGEVEAAESHFTDYRKIRLGKAAWVDLINDRELYRRAFEVHGESVVVYPGAFGEFVNQYFTRGAFIAFQAPDKTGKSIFLQDLAFRGAKLRRRVAFFLIGDMGKEDLAMRQAARMTGRPIKAGEIQYPTEIFWNAEVNRMDVRLQTRRYEEDMTWRDAVRAARAVAKRNIRSTEPYIRVFEYPSFSVDMYGVLEQARDCAAENWPPDICVIDYADNLDRPAGTDDAREGINVTWALMRALSQELHCLVVTATQTDAAAYDAAVIKRKNFSDNKRKLAHVTGMLAINRSDTERELGMARVNWNVLRHGKYVESRCVYVAGCNELSHPIIHSSFDLNPNRNGRQVPDPEEE